MLSDEENVAPAIVPSVDSEDEGKMAFAFGKYRLVPARRLLLAGNYPVELKPRAFEAVLALVEARGALVTKEQMHQRLWPNVNVDPHNLDQQISTLRKALGDDRHLIHTETGRGWRLAASVRTIPASSASEGRTNLPSAIAMLLGRENELVALPDLIAEHRLVTLTGAGGIGKTQLGLEAARLVLPRFSDGVGLVELAPLEDPELVTSTIARAIGAAPDANRSSTEQLVAILRRQHLLLVIDNCEHLIEAVARIAETLLHGAPRLHILATSQEPLEAEGEHIFRVHPLTVPPKDIGDIEVGLEHSAVQLFVRRARAGDQAFTLDAMAMAGISKICRHLDGNPLAIELAAGCVAAIGVDTLASRLEGRFQLLKGGRRSALQRHRSLEAALDWSYGLLMPAQQAVLRRIAVFAGSFTLDGAVAVAASDDIDESQVAEHVTALIKKSLVGVDMRRPTTRYHLLDTTRVYAREKLAESGDFGNTARRHASYYRALLEKVEAIWQTTPTSAAIATYALDVDDIRAALDRAFQPDGDAALGVGLAVALAPLWPVLSTMGEFRAIIARALAHVSEVSSDRMRHEVPLQTALAAASYWAQGVVSATLDASTRALALAEELGDVEHQLGALFILSLCATRRGDYRISLAIARRFQQIAETSSDTVGALIGARLEGSSLFYYGEYAQARTIMERVLTKMSPDMHHFFALHFWADQRVVPMLYLARILWTQGFPRQASLLSESIVEEVQALDHTSTMCMVLCDNVCAFAALADDGDTLEKFATVLASETEQQGMGRWRPHARAFKGVAAVKRGDIEIGLDLLLNALDGTHGTRVELRYTFFIEALAEALAATGRVTEAVDTVQRVLDDSLQNDGHSCVPEFLRLRGEFKLRENSENAASAERDFEDAIALSARQGARSWQLRAALSFARLRWRQGRSAEARAALEPVYDWFTEGFDTADLKAARALLEELR
jgi:predicted ATPase/DNA-binding winged helix-turn-helix (wHTH) protein